MKRWAAGAVVAGAISACIASAQSSFLPIDDAKYKALIQAHRGKVVLVDFWATWCEPCRTELPLLIKLAVRYRSKGFALATISADEPDKESEALQLLAREKAPRPVFVKRVDDDDHFISAIEPRWSGALPALFLYDRSGRKVKSFIGEADFKDVEAAVRKLL